MTLNLQLTTKNSELFEDPGKYRRMEISGKVELFNDNSFLMLHILLV